MNYLVKEGIYLIVPQKNEINGNKQANKAKRMIRELTNDEKDL